jgi:hypothetical protein
MEIIVILTFIKVSLLKVFLIKEWFIATKNLKFEIYVNTSN